jgi:hypothetical protein
LAKNKTDLMPKNASCKRWDTLILYQLVKNSVPVLGPNNLIEIPQTFVDLETALLSIYRVFKLGLDERLKFGGRRFTYSSPREI